ncbi:hypothetical protein TI39_contig5881g00010, partial [Zymoseptoria brevis]
MKFFTILLAVLPVVLAVAVADAEPAAGVCCNLCAPNSQCSKNCHNCNTGPSICCSTCESGSTCESKCDGSC